MINIDSVLSAKFQTIEEKDEITKLSKRAKKFSIISLISATLSSISYLIAFPSTYDFLHVFGAIFGISSLIISIIAFIHLIKAIKKIKKKGEKIKGQEKTIKNNIKTAFWISLLLLLAPIIGGIIFLPCIFISCSMSLSFRSRPTSLQRTPSSLRQAPSSTSGSPPSSSRRPDPSHPWRDPARKCGR